MALLKACQSGKRQIHQLFGWSSFHFVISGAALHCKTGTDQHNCRTEIFQFSAFNFWRKR
jgi:hypothetical protein